MSYCILCITFIYPCLVSNKFLMAIYQERKHPSSTILIYATEPYIFLILSPAAAVHLIMCNQGCLQFPIISSSPSIFGLFSLFGFVNQQWVYWSIASRTSNDLSFSSSLQDRSLLLFAAYHFIMLPSFSHQTVGLWDPK